MDPPWGAPSREGPTQKGGRVASIPRDPVPPEQKLEPEADTGPLLSGSVTRALCSDSWGPCFPFCFARSRQLLPDGAVDTSEGLGLWEGHLAVPVTTSPLLWPLGP